MRWPVRWSCSAGSGRETPICPRIVASNFVSGLTSATSLLREPISTAMASTSPRLEGVAKPGGIAISHSVRDQVGNRLDLVFEDTGEQKFKNIERPIWVYNVSIERVAARNNKGRAPAAEERPSIDVLPFNNMSGDSEQEYFSDGITEDIITDLSKVSGLSVVARHTAFTYKNRPVNVQEVGRELGVAYILEGSVRKAGARVRVTGQLIDSTNGNHLWADRFDRELTDIFAIQDEITHAIVEQLKVKLHPQERKSIVRAPTDNIEAYTYYLKGRDFLNRRSKRYLQLARRMFAKAVELDPRYARAYAGMADCDSYLYMTYHEQVDMDEVLATTEKALSLDPNLAEAHASRGVALSAGERYEEAKTEFEKAMVLDPDSYEAHYFYARSNFAQSNVDCAASLIEPALDLLEQCLPKLGHEKVQWAKYDSDFDPLRNHPRYQKLFERIDKG